MCSKNTIELNSEQISEIVNNCLVDDYNMVIDNIKSLELLKEIETLPPHKEMDLEDFKNWRDALKNILQWYSIPSEYREMFPD
jgi:hypothetical protein